jgi:glutathione synthase/RimK-type ligase-like ATP-grasp enzyme
MYHSGFLDAIRACAQRLNIQIKTVDKKNGRLIELTSLERSALFGADPHPMWQFNNSLSASIAADKELTLRLLKEESINIPQTEIAFYDINNYSHLEIPLPHVSQFINSPPFECPFVIKPNDAYSGRGIVFVYSFDVIEEAVECASHYSNALIFQELLKGDNCKIYSYQGKGILKIALKRVSLKGDGRNTVYDILRDYPPKSIEARLSLKSYFSRYGVHIFPLGYEIAPYPLSNYSETHNSGEMTTELTEQESLICQKVYTKLHLDFCTIDYMVDDRGDIKVLEVNSNPGIKMLYMAENNDLACKTIDFLVTKALRLC